MLETILIYLIIIPFVALLWLSLFVIIYVIFNNLFK